MKTHECMAMNITLLVSLLLTPARGEAWLPHSTSLPASITGSIPHILEPTADRQNAVPDRAFRDAYAQLPLSFIPNQGQWDSAVHFQAQGPGGTLFFIPQGLVLALPAPALTETRTQGAESFSLPDAGRPNTEPIPDSRRTIITMHFLDANPAPTLEGLDPLPGTVSFLLGNDPAR